MFILNYHISTSAINSIKNPKVKNVFCDTCTEKIKVMLYSENDEEEYTLQYDSNQICDFTSEEICRLTYDIFLKFDGTQHKSLLFDDIIGNIIDGIINSRENEYNSDDDDCIK